MHIQDPGAAALDPGRIERPYAKPSADEQLRILRRLNAAEAFETFLQTSTSGRSGSAWRAARASSAADELLSAAARADLDEVCIGMPHRGR